MIALPPLLFSISKLPRPEAPEPPDGKSSNSSANSIRYISMKCLSHQLTWDAAMEKLMKEVHALVCHGSRIKECQVFVSMFEQLSMKASKYRMPKARCWATPQRWLLTLDMISFRAALWNPFNLDKFELPSLENNLPQNCKCLLSCEPVSPGCVVLVVDADEPVIWFCYVGGKKWTRHEYNIIVEKPWLPSFLSLKRRREEHQRRCSREEESSEFILYSNCDGKRIRISSDAGHGMMTADPSERIQIRSIAAVERKFYFDMSPSKLGILEFHPEPTFSTLEFKRLPIEEYYWESSFPHLVESRGRLFLVVRFGGLHIYKMDFSKLAWSMVDGLYDQVFFLGRLHFTASYSAWELGLKQGNIYFLAPGEDRVVQLTNVFLSEDKHMSGSTYCPRTIDDLPASLLGIHNLLTKACGLAIGSS